MKRNEVNISGVWVRNTKTFTNGIGKVIGKRPNHIPYVVIEGTDGNVIAWIEARQMNALVKKWRVANP